MSETHTDGSTRRRIPAPFRAARQARDSDAGATGLPGKADGPDSNGKTSIDVEPRAHALARRHETKTAAQMQAISASFAEEPDR